MYLYTFFRIIIHFIVTRIGKKDIEIWKCIERIRLWDFATRHLYKLSNKKEVSTTFH